TGLALDCFSDLALFAARASCEYSDTITCFISATQDRAQNTAIFEDRPAKRNHGVNHDHPGRILRRAQVVLALVRKEALGDPALIPFDSLKVGLKYRFHRKLPIAGDRHQRAVDIQE